MSEIEVEKVEVRVISETAKAYQLQDGYDDSRKNWFPKSQVSFAKRNIMTGDAVAEIPAWLLKKEGWDE